MASIGGSLVSAVLSLRGDFVSFRTFAVILLSPITGFLDKIIGAMVHVCVYVDEVVWIGV